MLFQPVPHSFLFHLMLLMKEFNNNSNSILVKVREKSLISLGRNVNWRVFCQYLAILIYITFGPAIPHLGFYPQISYQKNASLRGREHPSEQNMQDT